MLRKSRECTNIIEGDLEQSFEVLAEQIKVCRNDNFPVKIVKEIGSGATASVYSAIMYIKGRKNVVIKDEFIPYMGDKDAMFYQLHNSVEISYKLGLYSIGPKVYDSFYTIDRRNGNLFALNHYLIMEHFDSSGRDALEAMLYNGYVKEIKVFVKKLINILFKLVNSDVFCTDIKLVNFLYKVNTQEVRITDFGSDFCVMGKVNDKTFKTYYLIVLLMVAEEVRELTEDAIEQRKISKNDQIEIMGLFQDNTIFSEIVYFSMKESNRGKIHRELINIKNMIENDEYGLGRTMGTYMGVTNIGHLANIIKKHQEFSPWAGINRKDHFTNPSHW